jgi:hypothetical protein
MTLGVELTETGEMIGEVILFIDRRSLTGSDGLL